MNNRKKDGEKETTNRESIETIFTEALAIPSFTNTETEQGIEAYLDQRLDRSPHFKEHPDYFGRYQVPTGSLASIGQLGLG